MPVDSSPSTLLDSLAQVVDASWPASGVPGLAVGVLVGGEEHVLVRGVTSVDNPLPVDERTLFQVGSTSKTFTALALVRLAEQGLVDLDVPVRRWVPELRMPSAQVADAVTLRHLLTHTLGQEGDLFDDFGGGRDCLSAFAAGMHVLPQLAPLGTWSYSNAGFSLAGRVLEAVTGSTFEDAVRELVLLPLELHESVYGAEAAITRRVAVGHRVEDGRPVVTNPWSLPRTSWPAGGLVSSVRDQLAYARFSLGDGTGPAGRLLSESMLRHMQSPLVAAGGGRAAAVGLSWLLQPTPGVIAHGGSTNGQESAFVLVSHKQFAITVLTNSSTGAFLHGPVVKWALRELAQVPSYKPETRPAAAQALPVHAGVFASLLEELHVDHTGDGLTLAMEPTAAALAVLPELEGAPPMPMSLFDDGRVLVTDGPLRGARGEFLYDGDQPIRLRMLGRIHVRR